MVEIGGGGEFDSERSGEGRDYESIWGSVRKSCVFPGVLLYCYILTHAHQLSS